MSRDRVFWATGVVGALLPIASLALDAQIISLEVTLSS